jgi:HEAT repeat protein
MPSKKILARLKGGDRRSIGRADEVTAAVSRHPQLSPELILGLWSEDPLVRMRAADAAEKVTRKNTSLLQPHKAELLGLMAGTQEKEMRWHLAAMVPRLLLSAGVRQTVVSLLNGYLKDRSSIVRTSALQGLADLAQVDSGIRVRVMEALREATRNGTPAMKARSRKLLSRLEHS